MDIGLEPVGLYGGTFDPVHRGHLHAALSVLKHLPLDRMYMILSARPGHRGEPACSIQDRWKMLQLACAKTPALVPDDGEIRREGHSYTIDTVKGYWERGFAPSWVVGMDSFVTMPEWYQWQSIPDFCNLIVIQRSGMDLELPAALAAVVEARKVDKLDVRSLGQVWFHAEPMLEVSATEVRRRLNANEDPSDLLDNAVWSYIRQHNLYAEVSV